MRHAALGLLVGCGFRGPMVGTEALGTDASSDVGDANSTLVSDATTDAPVLPALCPPDSHLRLCFSFDQSPLPSTLSNEGAAAVGARLTNVTHVAGATSAGAAQLTTASEIFVPYTDQVANIQSAEVWFRIDADASDGGRSGLYDSNVVPPNISLFFYRSGATHTLRAGMGGETVVLPATLPIATWLYVACVCDGANLIIYVDGLSIGSMAGSCATGGALVSPDGFTIGQNNNGGGSQAANDWLVGAIDGLRLWDIPLSATSVCQTAGRSGC